MQGHLNSNVAVQDAISKCFKDVPEKDSQSDPASQIKNWKARYEKLVRGYKNAIRKVHERGDEIEGDSVEPEDDGEENDEDDNNEEVTDENPQNDDEISENDGKDSPLEDAAKDELIVDGKEATEDSAKDAQSADDKSVGKDTLGLPENDAEASKNDGEDRKEDPLQTQDNALENKVAEEEVNGDISEELDDPNEDEAINGAANEADGDESSSKIPASELVQKG